MSNYLFGRKHERLENPDLLVSASAILESQRLPAQAAELLNVLLELVKIRITFFVGMSAAFGYLLAGGDITARMAISVLGIFLLSCASAAMNHYQERDTDSIMHRTNKRPLPVGIVTLQSVLLIIVSFALAGSILIALAANITALALSWLAFLSYNAIYTPLKKITPFAVIPGSLVGSFPVMAGWAAAGGDVFDPRLIAVTAFFFIWQIPHFWLLMDMYSADYERANFPTLRMYFSDKVLAVLTYLWMAILALTSVFFVTTGIVDSLVPQIAIAALGIWLILGTYSIIPGGGEKRTVKSAFMKINIYVLAVTLVVMVDLLLKKI